MKIVRTKVPLKRAQSPESIGQLAVCPACEESDDIAGQAINVDGGAVFS